MKGKSFEYKDIQEKHLSATLDDKQTALSLALIICNEEKELGNNQIEHFGDMTVFSYT